mgnify:CR=1 FL=1
MTYPHGKVQPLKRSVRFRTYRLCGSNLYLVYASKLNESQPLSAPLSRNDNLLLDALPESARKRLFPHLDSVPMPLGKVLYESGDTLEHVYFPKDAIVSLLYVMESGASAEISVVGNEGMIGISLFM